MYKISIIMPIFNTEKYIERSFNSILNQTMNLEDIEVIMVDDCSTDNTRNIVREYEKKYPNFKAVYHEKNSGGCAVPRNSGLKVATGEYVMFLDPDDEYAPDMCETLYNKIKTNNVELVKCNHELIVNNKSTIDYNFNKEIPEIILDCKQDAPSNSVSVCNVIHDRKFLEKNNITFPELKNAEDGIFSITEFFKANKMIILNNYAGYKYYTNPEISHSMKGTSENLEIILSGLFTIRDIIKKNGRTEIYHDFFSVYSFQFFLRVLNYNGNKTKYFKKFYEFERSLNCTLTFKYSWLNLVNKFIVKNHISLAVFVFNGLTLIRKTPFIKIYRKLLFR